LVKRIGIKALEDVAHIVKPQTILDWFRKLVAKKFDGSKKRKGPGRPPVDPEIVKLILRMAAENPSWGYDRIAGAITNLGHKVCDQTVGNVLEENGIPPAPKRESTWHEFISKHKDVLCACDFFTTEVITPHGLITFYVLFFIHIGSRRVHIAGVTVNPDEQWMKQIARNLTMADYGFLENYRYLIMDRDKKFCASFRKIIEDSGLKIIRLPPESPNLNSFAERYVKSIKNECLSKLIFFGEESLRRALKEFVEHYHEERNHQGIGNVIPFPNPEYESTSLKDEIVCKTRLGGLLKFYYRKAA
jgi:hypothetical protein